MTPKLRRIIEFLQETQASLKEVRPALRSPYQEGQLYEATYILDKVWEIISDDSR